MGPDLSPTVFKGYQQTAKVAARRKELSVDAPLYIRVCRFEFKYSIVSVLVDCAVQTLRTCHILQHLIRGGNLFANVSILQVSSILRVGTCTSQAPRVIKSKASSWSTIIC